MRRSLAVMAAALLASFWLGCPGSGSTGGATGGACGTSTDVCTFDTDCCAQFICQIGHCAFQGGGNGNGDGTGSSSSGNSSGGASTGDDHGSSTGQGINSSSTGSPGGSIGGGSTGGGSTGGSSTGGGSTGTTYCDGLQLTSGTNNTVLLETYLFAGQLTTDGCAPTLAVDADGSDLQTVGGIYDVDTNDNGAATASDAIFPAGCDDLGLSTFVPPSGAPYTPPTGASTIAAAYAPATPTAVSIYGVVTAIRPWVATPTAKGGQLYLQDPTSGTPAPKSGVLVYFPVGGAATYGTAPVRGDVIEVTAVTWSPYKGQNQFAAATTAVVTILGTSPLPAPVSLGSVDVGPTATTNGQQYWGMRVTVNDGSFSVTGSGPSGDCPASLEDTSTN
jgi:hypothetical protein